MDKTLIPQEPDGTPVAPPKTRASWYTDWILLPAVAVVLGMDQLSKYLIRTNLTLGEYWPSEGLFRFTHGTNTGSAFGLFTNQTTFLIVASVFAIGFLVYFYKTQALPRPLLRLAIGLQLGGAFGNLLDRLRTGAVVDFIDVGWWPTFNVADSSIVVGIALLMGILVLGYPGDRNTTEREPRSPADDHGVGR